MQKQLLYSYKGHSKIVTLLVNITTSLLLNKRALITWHIITSGTTGTNNYC